MPSRSQPKLLQNMVTKLVLHIPGATTEPLAQEGCVNNINVGGMRLRTGNTPTDKVLNPAYNMVIGVYTPSRNGGLLLKVEGVTTEEHSAYLLGFSGNWRYAAHDLNTPAMYDVSARLAQSVIVLGRSRNPEYGVGATLLMKEGAVVVATNTSTNTSYVLRAANGVIESV